MNSKNLLITFGCSWTYGVGINYRPGMSHNDLLKEAWNQQLCDNKSFRGILASELGADNINFSEGGSSNQRQFRLAKQYFASKDFLETRKNYKNITVLWGITSTARNEMYNVEKKGIQNFFLHKNDHPITTSLVKYCYNQPHEVMNLAVDMRFWNVFFENLGIINYWFDTFNHHDYGPIDYSIEDFQSEYNELARDHWPTWEKFVVGDMKSVPLKNVKEIYRIKTFGNYLKKNHPKHIKIQRLIEQATPRDVASYLAIKHGWKYNPLKKAYHYSNWKIDNDCIRYLTDKKLLNPLTYHPTEECHIEIAEFFKPYIKT